ncbi:2'-5' RNA ligase family protein [Chromobacterium sp. ASV23]|uniref:2'-5' RNA ligase family protein n=1 Tax=Chromobacterium sp. ASV23 TaxID=2795110 RepID=UPI0018EAC70B|nr:2'-5' RNA ligase family protein [Chromobacterium sp. ASV23]
MLESRAIYLVLDVPTPLKEQVQALRDTVCPRSARLPVEITLAGSSGLGPMPADTSLESIAQVVDALCAWHRPFDLRLGPVHRFAGTGIYYLPPWDRQPFDRLHQALAVSGLPWRTSAFTYEPHCTVRNGPPLGEVEHGLLMGAEAPASSARVESLSVYRLDRNSLACECLYRSTLSA